MIKIITVGKIKEKYLTDAINEYLKRLSKYTKINLIEVPDENFDITKTLETEKKSILKYVSEKELYYYNGDRWKGTFKYRVCKKNR